MRRRYRTRTKYSVNTIGINQDYGTTAIDKGANVNQPIVPPTEVFGTRKVKNFDINLALQGFNSPLLFAIVYVPEGTVPLPLNVNGYVAPSGQTPAIINEMYKPNQNVICHGILLPGNNNVYKIRSKLSRNLDSGDSIFLVMAPMLDCEVSEHHKLLVGTITYAIKF